MDRIIIKPCLYRLAKAGKIQLMGGGSVFDGNSDGNARG
jgi:hypothetical protein